MSNKAINWAFSLDLDSTAKSVLVVLASHANTAFQCWPSLATIARETGLRPCTVARALKRLVDLGLVQRKRRRIKNGKLHRTTLYTVLIGARPQERMLPSATAVVADSDNGSCAGDSRVIAERDTESSKESSREILMESTKPQKLVEDVIDVDSQARNTEVPVERPEPSHEAREIWVRMRPFVQKRLDPQRYTTWVEAAVLFVVQPRQNALLLHFWVPNAHFQAWLSNRADLFLTAAKQAGLRGQIICLFHAPKFEGRQ